MYSMTVCIDWKPLKMCSAVLTHTLKIQFQFNTLRYWDNVQNHTKYTSKPKGSCFQNQILSDLFDSKIEHYLLLNVMLFQNYRMKLCQNFDMDCLRYMNCSTNERKSSKIIQNHSSFSHTDTQYVCQQNCIIFFSLFLFCWFQTKMCIICNCSFRLPDPE